MVLKIVLPQLLVLIFSRSCQCIGIRDFLEAQDNDNTDRDGETEPDLIKILTISYFSIPAYSEVSYKQD